MKSSLHCLCIFALSLSFTAYTQNTSIPDSNFEQALIDLGYDTGTPDGSVPTANISGITTLDVSNKNIANLTGIEHFTALTDLNCAANQLTSISINTLTQLEALDCSDNQLSSLNVSANTALLVLACEANQLTSLDVSSNTLLETLDCEVNQLTSLNVSLNTALEYLYISGNQLTTFDASSNIALRTFYCYSNQLTSLTLPTSSTLVRLYAYWNQLTSLDVTGLTALERFYCYNNQLTSLDVRNGNNMSMTDSGFRTNNNPDLSCIYVDNATWSTTNWLNYHDAASNFVETVTDCMALSLGDSNSSPFSIYFDPYRNILHVEGFEELLELNVRVYDLNGKLVFDSNELKSKFSFEKLVSGVYLIQVFNGINLVVSKKWIKK